MNFGSIRRSRKNFFGCTRLVHSKGDWNFQFRFGCASTLTNSNPFVVDLAASIDSDLKVEPAAPLNRIWSKAGLSKSSTTKCGLPAREAINARWLLSGVKENGCT